MDFIIKMNQQNQKLIQRIKLNTPADRLKLAAYHHIQSFNYIYQQGLSKILQYISPMELINREVLVDNKPINLPFTKFKLSFTEIHIGKPFKANDPTALIQQTYPQDCRLGGKTYSAPLICEFIKEVDNVQETFTATVGQIPIMVRSKHCHLYGLGQKELIKQNEDPIQYGGYFIINGNEKIIRMLIVQKRNFPVAFIRPSYTNRGPGYTQYAIQMRCVREDYFARTITLHYISDGNIFLRILYKKQEFLIPLIIIIKALGQFSDLQIYNRLIKGKFEDSAKSDKIEVLIKTCKSMGYTTKEQCLGYLGNNFRYLLNIGMGYTDIEAGEVFLNQNICVHLCNNHEKFNILCLMVDKLYALVNNQIESDNLDSLCNHEVLLPGHLYLMILRQKLQDLLSVARARIIKDSNHQTQFKKVRQSDYLKRIIETGGLTKQVENFLSTGNLKSRTGLDLMQDKGFTVIADKLNNMRFLSHFRSIHRGAYFAEMKTTTVRKLLPESWGFLCPVHTPDGGPCGLLNHLTINCVPQPKDVFDEKKHQDLEALCIRFGVIPIANINYIGQKLVYPVLIDGLLVGYIQDNLAEDFVNSMRIKKIKQNIPKQTEIAWLKKTSPKYTAYPMIFLSYAPARMLRPVTYLPLNSVQFISPLQQIYLDIETKNSLHNEIHPSNILSILPQHIPFMNYNQSPRNMYQCQMAKQTMGTSVLNWDYRYDNKLYRIMTSQLPIVKTKIYQDFGFHLFNSGCNGVVAVISYTGYDMEDAMIINKSSFERGFGHGIVYKTVQYIINKEQDRKKQKYKLFKDAPNEKKKQFELPSSVDSDGLVKVGAKLKKGTVVLVLFDILKNTFKEFRNKESEPSHVDGIILTSMQNNIPENIFIKLRFDRRPVIGDKFSSRHGQKGVLSTLWPQIDMPFTETGITPDVIINPNAFPSRMTIGMLIESMVGKSSAMEGKIRQFQPFEVYEGDNILEYFGNKLLANGYNYFGNQTMYSGVYGTELKVDIYLGLVYYQRLRHMVSDKSQARSTGPVDILTQQPLKGRKKGGGIRMGEMERDAMLSHGLSHILNERLFKSSDYSEAHICNKCGSLIACYLKIEKMSGESMQEVFKQTPTCRACNNTDCSKVAIPYVMKYLTNELASMNIKLSFRLKQ